MDDEHGLQPSQLSLAAEMVRSMRARAALEFGEASDEHSAMERLEGKLALGACDAHHQPQGN